MTATSNNLETRSQVFANLQVKLAEKRTIADVKAMIDTGAQGNTLPVRMYHRMYPENLDAEGFPRTDTVKNTHVVLTAYNNGTIPHYGTVTLQCKYEQPEWLLTEFYIVESDGPAILGLTSARKMHLVTLHCSIATHEGSQSCQNRQGANSRQPISSIDDLTRQYPEQFDGIGNFEGKYRIVLREEVHPIIHAPRKCPIHLKDELKAELDKM